MDRRDDRQGVTGFPVGHVWQGGSWTTGVDTGESLAGSALVWFVVLVRVSGLVLDSVLVAIGISCSNVTV
jgi:hypothetical protein